MGKCQVKLGLNLNSVVQDSLDQGLIFVPQDQIINLKDQMDALWELGRTPIKVACLEKYLKYYPDSKTSLLLLDGFRNAFSLQYSGPRTLFISKNLKSAELLKTETHSKLNKETTLGRMSGPFKNMPISTLRTSPIGMVNKSDWSLRLIMHLSFPNGCSVNDFVDPNETSVKYTSFDEVIDMVSSLGKGARLGVQDIKSAFRLLPISPGDFDLLGIYFDGNFYVDKSLPFGCSIGCALFEKFSTFLHWLVVSSAGKHSVKQNLDDFIFGGSATLDDCLVLMNTFTELCNELGVPIAEDKTIHPTTRLTFLGLEIDTVDMVVRIPVAKLIKLRSQLQPMTIKRKIKFKDLESLVGLLAFCSRAVPSSRAFLRRFYDVIASFKVMKPFFSVRITSEIREDVLVWLEFLKSFNGDSYIIVRQVQKVRTIGGGYTRNSPSGVHRPDLQTEIDRLIVSAVAPNTSKVYQQALRSFKDFMALFQFEDLWPIPLHHITNYIAYKVGELIAYQKHASTQSHALDYKDIKINLSSIEIRLRSSKTDQCCTGTTIVIDDRPGDVCAVFALRNYLKIRPNVAGQLFCHFDGTPITRYQFSGVLKKSLNVLGLSQGKYTSHSFRIGAATSAAMNGLSDSEIQTMGRWKSDSFRSYIRIQQCL
ncbi:unnamed protein product [Mytilus coruscus]|uniref:Reverse transcriptase domain-containing protein n=1 Tax=Mytilus coruscus TaxID=42192 RepID=A0A6J8EKL9_MYTCO|nr:unnamed protein product [Mytilus coruscus]